MTNSALHRYLETANATSLEVQISNPEAIQLLDECVTHIDSLLNVEVDDFDGVVWPLAANTQFLYLAAIRIALSGHVTAIFPVLRTAIESACYALVTASDEKKASLWPERNKSKTKRDSHRAAFSPAVFKAISMIEENCDVMSRYIQGVYEASIDYGGHPNPRSIVRHLKTSKTDEDRVQFGCLYGPGTHLDTALMACLDFGAAIIYLLRMTLNLDPFPGNDDSFLARFMAKKNEYADHLNGSPIEYTSQMYEQLD